ncbi:hypothetical protein [Halomonas cupida]|uniref:hypothetical protein n=1 Tax=Halomonas cupida TaxID=44933 RepID=UPI0011613A42|nr:hypothetical protein [Halomonas cupida]
MINILTYDSFDRGSPRQGMAASIFSGQALPLPGGGSGTQQLFKTQERPMFVLKYRKENVEGANGAGGGGIDVGQLKQVFEEAAQKSMEVSKAKTEGNTEVDTARSSRPNN